MILFFNILSIASNCQVIDTLGSSFLYKNSVHTELFGNGSVYSFGYERILLNGQKFKTSGLLEFAVYPSPLDLNAEYLVNILLDEIISFNKHHIEIGFGYGVVKERKADFEVYDPGYFDYFTGRLCYRFQKPKGRFVFRIGYTPFFDFDNDNNSIYYESWGGISFGYSFGKK